jgi:hypothetical protein
MSFGVDIHDGDGELVAPSCLSVVENELAENLNVTFSAPFPTNTRSGDEQSAA